jgi:hypothetical protein
VSPEISAEDPSNGRLKIPAIVEDIKIMVSQYNDLCLLNSFSQNPTSSTDE